MIHSATAGMAKGEIRKATIKMRMAGACFTGAQPCEQTAGDADEA